METEEGVGRFHQVLPEDKATEFPGVAAAASGTAQRRLREFARSQAAVARSRNGFHRKPGEDRHVSSSIRHICKVVYFWDCICEIG